MMAKLSGSGVAARGLLVALLAATVLTGCGRKGPLDRPGVSPNAASAQAESSGFGEGLSDFDNYRSVPDEPPVVPERRFILDPLLD